jgi:uncharacterized protein YecE (DUF72 family)
MTTRPGQTHIGTSGWSYKHWKGPFYPKSIKEKELLAYYADHFHAVEINNSFYRLPEEKTLRNWMDNVSSDFIFCVKASRYITHLKKLKDVEESLNLFLKRVETLKNKLGPILFQLPPRWRFNQERFFDFLEMLPDHHRYAFEFRDQSWHNPEALEAMKLMGASFCIYEIDGYISPKEITADFIYIRLHGPGAAYQGNYNAQTLSGWAGAFSSWSDQGNEIFCFFDNDESGYAIQNACNLNRMINRK